MRQPAPRFPLRFPLHAPLRPFSRALTTGLLALALLGGCKEEDSAANIPAALPLDEEAAGFYCQMALLEHVGPKAQAHLAGLPAPIWFSQVRDGLAYLKSPEQNATLLVLYVNDMGAAADWAHPGADNWIDAGTAFYVVGSDAVGGMGAPELVPFARRADAETFAAGHGGTIMTLDEIPAEVVLSPVEFDDSRNLAGTENTL